MVTGGVSGNNIKEWFAAGTDAVGTGALQSVKKGSHENLVAQLTSLQHELQ